MTLDYTTLDLLRQNHPAWRLLRSEHAPLVASFLQRAFIAPNLREIAQADLVEALDDELFTLRERSSEAFPKRALDYLNDWAAPDKAWLRKFYRQGSDEPYFDLTPATEKAITWLARELLADFREGRARRHCRLRPQGRSFRAFWDFLMSSSRPEELSSLLEHVLALPAVAGLKPDTRLRWWTKKLLRVDLWKSHEI